MSPEVLGRFRALRLLDSAFPLAEEAVEVIAPAIKAPDTTWQPRVWRNKCFFSAAASSKGEKDGDEPCAPTCCRDGAPGAASLPAASLGACGGQQSPRWRAVPAARALVPGRSPHSHRSSRSQGKAETGRLHTGGLRQAGWGGARHRKARAV